ncbi:hypothetical protein [Nostoc sp. UIC 10630]|uniref:hypothetical protein n=1 Tax=Nostoc sp. UIC 10630 TaxID=2100146 RepID=UPI0013FA8A9C|nr:hypothetical protein [Nostoc sp. UIC 10630]NEU82669.1 hypothetical protein [Nostoc sp. UIC 10630]
MELSINYYQVLSVSLTLSHQKNPTHQPVGFLLLVLAVPEFNRNSTGIQSELSRNSIGTLGAETIANSGKLCS